MADSKRKKSVAHKKESADSQGVEEQNRMSPRTITGLVSLLFGVLLFVSYFDVSGAVLSWLRSLFCGLFGKVTYWLGAMFLFSWTLILFTRRDRSAIFRSIALWMLVITVSAMFDLFAGALPSNEEGVVISEFAAGKIGLHGGIFGGYLSLILQSAFGSFLAFFFLFISIFFWALEGVGVTVDRIVDIFRNDNEKEEKEYAADKVISTLSNTRSKFLEHKKALTAGQEVPLLENSMEENKKDSMPQKKHPSIFKSHRKEEPEQLPEPVTKGVAVKNSSPFVEDDFMDFAEDDLDMNLDVDLDFDRSLVDEPMPPVQKPMKEKVTSQDAELSAQMVANEIAEQSMSPQAEYEFPPIELLHPSRSDSNDGTAEMRENTRILNEKLQSFHIEAHICNVTRGPSVTRYEVELAQGVRLAKITALQDDIALALGAVGVRISAIPEISVVGIEVPNKQVTTVCLRDVIDSPQFIRAKSKSTFAVGKDIGGTCIVGDIARLPHMLIAGTTGSGKSVCMNGIIISILYKSKPEDVKLIMVDPKMVELGIYNGIPHLLIPVVTDPKKAAGSLQWAVTEMMRRYKTMSDMGVRDVESYNRIVESSGEGEKLPQIVVIIDELADLMLVAAKEVEESICRLAQMGRASGMHLIIATQRPSADVITGLMKANIPSRIAFAVSSAMESRIILDTMGAEKLVGRGDMLYAPVGKGKPKRIQGCFVGDDEIEAVTEFIKAHSQANYNDKIQEEIDKKAEQSGKSGKQNESFTDFTDGDSAHDDLLPDAVEVVLDTGMASVSMLQRRLKLGYARAARIVDEMEEMGIVGPFSGSKPRNILITREQWQQMQDGSYVPDAEEAEDEE